MAGLMASRALAAAGRSVLVVDKGRSVGGRLATRRLGGGKADTGAQFFTSRSPVFQAEVSAWQAQGLVAAWPGSFGPGSRAEPAAARTRYAVPSGMNALARELSRGLGCRTEVTIQALSPNPEGWLARDSEGRTYQARAALVTAPVPQALAMLEAGGAHLHNRDLEALRAVGYAPCLAGLFVLDRPPAFPESGALPEPGPRITWAADNQRKGISPAVPVVTVHASPEFSRARYAHDDADVLAELWADLESWHGGSVVVEAQLKRWRYARATEPHPGACLAVEGLAPLVFAGDGFGESRVEAAALSGLAAAEALAGRLG